MKTSFPVIGMHCASCARLIERSLKKTPGVMDAAVNYGSERAAVEFDETNYENWIALGRVYMAVIPLKITGAYEKIEFCPPA